MSTVDSSAPSLIPRSLSLANSRLAIFLTSFYRASDVPHDDDPTAYPRFFQPDATLIMGPKRFHGTLGIIEFRKEAWAQVQAREHTVQGVYNTAHEHGHEAANTETIVMIQGSVVYTLRDGTKSHASWAARMVVLDEADEQYKIEHYQVWLVGIAWNWPIFYPSFPASPAVILLLSKT